MRNKIILGVGTMLTLSAVTIGFQSFTTTTNYFEVSKNIEIYTDVYKELNTYYIDQIDPAELMSTGINAMLESLDPYTNYIPESKIQDFRFMSTGKYGGIGASIRKDGDKVMIVQPYKGFAADKAGLRAGDVFLEVDGKSAIGKNTDEISDILKGNPGTDVSVKIERPGTENAIDLTITREEVKVDNVPYYGMVDNEVGYILLTTFSNDAGKNVKNAYNELKKENPNMKGVILDLRNNGGGLLNEAVNVCNVFIDNGETIVTTKGRVKEWDKTFATKSSVTDDKIPVAVLINENSASASEIVSGVIQDYDRGIIIGARSYGKGLVQNTRNLSYNSKIKLTTSKYYLPSGRCVQAIDYASGKYGEKASTEKLADSLRTSFKTTNGRTVLDGGGVDPDIDVEDKNYASITKSLVRKNLIFKYLIEYRLQNPTIAEVEDYKFTDSDYQKFTAWLSDKEYDYTTSSERLLEKLKEKAEEEQYYESIKSDLATLEKKVTHDKETDLVKYKAEITDIIQRQVAEMYYYREGQIEISLRDDTEIKEAVKVLKNEQEYNTVLANK